MAERILVRAPNWIGDQILAYPFFHTLREAFPRAYIASACVEWVAPLQFQNCVDEVIVMPRKMSGDSYLAQFSALEEASKLLKARGPWDLAMTLPNSLSSAWLLYRSGARTRRGYGVEGRWLLLNESLPWNPDPARHRAQAYVDLLQGWITPSGSVREFWGVPPENALDPAIPGILNQFDAAGAWKEARPLGPPPSPYWILAPGSQAESRRWPEEYYFELAAQVFQETKWKGVVIGGPSEAPMAERLCERAGGSAGFLQDLTAQGAPSRLWRVFRGAEFTVANESGLAHVAALCGSFVQIVCGAADPMRTRPLGPGRVQVAVNPVECWPCEKNSCALPAPKTTQCLLGLKPSLIWKEIQRGLELSRGT